MGRKKQRALEDGDHGLIDFVPLTVAWIHVAVLLRDLESNVGRYDAPSRGLNSPSRPAATLGGSCKAKARRRRCSSSTLRRSNAGIAGTAQVPSGCGYNAHALR